MERSSEMAKEGCPGGSRLRHGSMPRIGRILAAVAFLSAGALYANPHYTQGKLAFSAKNYGAALGHFRLALQADPSNGNPLFYIGYILDAQKQKEEAVQSFRQAIELRMDNDLREKSFWKILVYYKYNEDWENLEIYASRFLQYRDSAEVKKLKEMAEEKRDPALKEIHNLMKQADASLKKEDINAARITYQKAVEMKPRFQPPRWELVLLEMKVRKFDEAYRHLQTLIEINPASWEYRYKAGVCATQMGKADQALAHFADARKNNEKPDETFISYIALGEGIAFVEKGSYAEAIKRLEPVVKKKKSPAGLGALARAYHGEKQESKAAAAASEALTYDANQEDALAVKALISMEGGKRSAREASLAFQKLITKAEKDPLPGRFRSDFVAAVVFGCAHPPEEWKLVDRAGAIIGKELSASAPEFAALHKTLDIQNWGADEYAYCMARADLELNRPENAVSRFRQLIPAKFDTSGHWLDLARAHAAAGNVEDTKASLLRGSGREKADDQAALNAYWARAASEPKIRALAQKEKSLDAFIKNKGKEPISEPQKNTEEAKEPHEGEPKSGDKPVEKQTKPAEKPAAEKPGKPAQKTTKPAKTPEGRRS